MARTYKRDSNGRFAGGGGGGGRKGVKLPAPAARKVGSKPQRRRGLLTQRAAVKSTKAKLAAKDPADRSIKGTLSRRSQKGAVTKANKALQAAQQSGRIRLGARAGVIKAGRGGGKAAAVKATPKKPAPKATQAQRNMRTYLNDNRGRNKADLRFAANALRTTLSKKEQAASGVKTLGGYIDKMASVAYKRSKYGLDRAQVGSIQSKIERAVGSGGIKGVRIRQDSAGRYQLDVDSLTRRQSTFAEKSKSRKPRRRR